MIFGVIYRSRSEAPNPFALTAGETSNAKQIKNLKLQECVNDFAAVLSAQAKEELTSMCTEIDQKAKAKLAVVTVSSLEGEPVEQFSNDLATRWGEGRKQPRGVLILLAPNEGKSRIEVGDGLEPILSEDKIGRFDGEGAQLLQQSNYEGATLLLAQRVAAVIGVDRTAEQPPQAPGPSKPPQIVSSTPARPPDKSTGQQVSNASTSRDANGKLSEDLNSIEASCARGDAADCRKLGLKYANGDGTAKDESHAAQLYQKSCDGGDALGCSILGAKYLNGQGVTKDESRAAQLFQKGCDAGDALDCSSAGRMYVNGQGVTKDESRAAQLYQKSCDAGDELGCSNLGVMYKNGQGVTKDESRGDQLLQKGCDLGYTPACASVKK